MTVQLKHSAFVSGFTSQGTTSVVIAVSDLSPYTGLSSLHDTLFRYGEGVVLLVIL